MSAPDIARQLLKLEYTRRRIMACGWFAAFFFNPVQRFRALRDWPQLCECVAFSEQVTLARTAPITTEQPAARHEIERALSRARSEGPAAFFSETELLLPRDSSLGPDAEAFKSRLLGLYIKNGIAVEPGLESLADTLPAEFAFLQAMILQKADEREQARFFFGHLRPLAYASIAAIASAGQAQPLERVTELMRRYLVTEEALFKAGFDGLISSERVLN